MKFHIRQFVLLAVLPVLLACPGPGPSPAPPSVAVTIQGPSTLETNKSAAFTATVTGSSNTSVTWTCTGGSISPSGAYTAPASPGQISVTATSVADTTKNAQLVVMVTQGNRPPTVPTIAGPDGITVGLPATYTFASTDADGDAISYLVGISGGGSASGEGTSRVVTVPSAGSYTLSVQAQDAKGLTSGIATKTFVAAAFIPAPPVQAFVGNIYADPLRAASPSDFEPGGTFTLEAWVYLTEGDNLGYAWIMGKAEPEAGGGALVRYGIHLQGDSTRVKFSTNSAQLVSPDPLPMRTWTHVAASIQGTTAALFINGARVASSSGAGPVPPAPAVYFGVGSPFWPDGKPNHPPYKGLYVRQVRFWHAARTETQIRSGMGQMVPLDATGLVASWPMDERSGAVARDLSGHGLGLTRTHGFGVMRRKVLENGPFFTETHYAPELMMPNPVEVMAIDFDHDGDLDLVVSQYAGTILPSGIPRRLVAFRNNQGTFINDTDAVFGVINLVGPALMGVADFNGDGRDDLFVPTAGLDSNPAPGEQSRLFIQSADGRLVDETATRLPAAPTTYTHRGVVGDINHDGFPDLFMCNFNDFPRLYRNDGAGRFTDAHFPEYNEINGPDRPSTAALVDVNGDGYAEVITGASATPGNNGYLILNDRSGGWVLDPAYALPPKLLPKETPYWIASGDFDGNGTTDLVMAGGDVTPLSPMDFVPALRLLLNDGTGHFRDASSQLNLTFTSYDPGFMRVTAEDMNGDGKLDLLLRGGTDEYSKFSHPRCILLNRGNGVFVDASDAFAAWTNLGVWPGDFDQDGIMDLVTVSPVDYGLRVFRGVKRLDLSFFDE